MKMNKFAFKLSVVASCIAVSVFAFANPTHAQWIFMGSTVVGNEPVDNNSGSQGNANQAADFASGFLAVTSGGHSPGNDPDGTSANGDYDLVETQKYVWEGSGTPPELIPVETDTLTALANYVPDGGGTDGDNATATAGVYGTSEIATAHEDHYGINNTPLEEPDPITHSLDPIDTDGATTWNFDTTIGATASGQVQAGSAYAAQGKTQTSFQ